MMTVTTKIFVGFATFALAAGAATAETQLHEAHSKLGMTCTSCHLNENPQAVPRVESEKCIACHGDLKKVSETIKKKKAVDPDPHWNHMIDIACSDCHKEHRPGVNICEDCHNLEYKVP